MKIRIPIVFATDENYIFYTCVSITSLAQSAEKGTFYDIYILVEEDFEDNNEFVKKLNLRYQNIKVSYINVNKEIFSNVNINNSHVTKATFYRLILAEVLKEHKCIYLDSDIIVTEDLTALFMTDLEDYYIAGCRDIWIDMLSEEQRESRRIKTMIPTLDQYINAGVLLFNLEKIRKDGMSQIFSYHMTKNYPYEDQDILNVSCYNKILRLPAKWNIFSIFLGRVAMMRKHEISQKVISDFTNKKGIIHFATTLNRPWESETSWGNYLWWKNADKWKEESVYKRIKEKVRKIEYENSIKFYLDKCEKYERIAIFGYTQYGKEICDWLINNKIEKKIVFIDNNIEKQGLNYKGKNVISLEECCRDNSAALYINTSQRRNEEVKKILLDFGIKEEDIISYIRKRIEYYSYIDEKNYSNVLNDICLREYGASMDSLNLNYNQLVSDIREKSEYEEWINRYHMKVWLLKE